MEPSCSISGYTHWPALKPRRQHESQAGRPPSQRILRSRHSRQASDRALQARPERRDAAAEGEGDADEEAALGLAIGAAAGSALVGGEEGEGEAVGEAVVVVRGSDARRDIEERGLGMRHLREQLALEPSAHLAT